MGRENIEAARHAVLRAIGDSELVPPPGHFRPRSKPEVVIMIEGLKELLVGRVEVMLDDTLRVQVGLIDSADKPLDAWNPVPLYVPAHRVIFAWPNFHEAQR